MEFSDRKDKLFYQVLDAAIALDVRQGHLKWKISDLSRKSKVTRTLIYYYFGKSKSEMLMEAVRLFGSEIAGLNNERLSLWNEGEIEKSVVASRELCQKLPHFVLFYYAHRGADNPVGIEIRDIEKRYLKKIKTYLPDSDTDQALAVFGILLGLTFAPSLSPRAISRGVLILKAGLKG